MRRLEVVAARLAEEGQPPIEPVDTPVPFSPEWSPDGRWIAFTDGENEVQVHSTVAPTRSFRSVSLRRASTGRDVRCTLVGDAQEDTSGAASLDHLARLCDGHGEWLLAQHGLARHAVDRFRGVGVGQRGVRDEVAVDLERVHAVVRERVAGQVVARVVLLPRRAAPQRYLFCGLEALGAGEQAA